MATRRTPERVEHDVVALATRLAGRRTVLLGASGAGKSVLARALGRELRGRGIEVELVSADPGRPAFGVPGSLGLARVDGEGEPRAHDLEALCSLDAARFRLPLVLALRRRVARSRAPTLLVDAPGVTQGMAAAELLPALLDATRADTLLVLRGEDDLAPLAGELASSNARVLLVDAAPGAVPPPWLERARARTALWDAYLKAAVEQRLTIDGLALLGAPPPIAIPAAWAGRQVAVLDADGGTLTLGEVVAVEVDAVVLRAPRFPAGAAAALLVRDAHRDPQGLLTTVVRPLASGGDGLGSDMLPDPAAQPELRRPQPVHVAGATVVLVNGIFGDPLLHARFRQARRSLLFDLGEAARLQARITHQVSDAFVTHAHFDHFAGFLWLLRSRIGLAEPCRVFGPPGLAAHAAGLVGGIRWDRVGDDGPRFEILELDGDRLRRFALQAGKPLDPMGERPVVDGVVLEEPGFRVRAVVLDHGIPVIAYALEAELQANVRGEVLRETGYPPGPWLDELKRALRGGAPATLVTLPDGSTRQASTLAHLVDLRPGDRLVYATDFGDTPANRERLVALARGAHTLFCEATFTSDDVAQARRTSHLTARACGEIAVAAGVGQLVPFHFSRRYEHAPERIYAEVRAVCGQVMITT